jgi:predicted N-acetyltransferase YhbS
MTSQLTRQEIGDLLDVLNVTFGAWGDDKLFQWKYTENPFGESLHMLSYDGHQAVGCVSFWRNDIDELRAYQCVDLAVLASHRRRGIFREAVADCLEHLAGAYVYTFPGGHSRPGFLKLGWRIKRRIRISVQLTPTVLRRHEKSSPLADEYVQWRFVNHPARQYFVSRLGSRPYLVTQRRNKVYAVAGVLSRDFGLPEVRPRFLFSYDFFHPPFHLPGRGGYILENPCYVSYAGYIPSYRADTF